MKKLKEFCSEIDCFYYIEQPHWGYVCNMCKVYGSDKLNWYYREDNVSYKEFLNCPNRNLLQQMLAVEKL